MLPYEDLCLKARHAAEAYYEKDSPIMSDQEYDALILQIEAMEKADPSLRHPNSPTRRVGGRAVEGFKKVKHPKKILSLKNAYNDDDLEAFFKTLPEYEPGIMFSVQPKYDGLTLVCKYVGGKFVQAVTRGDGNIGEDVTENAKHIIGLPLVLENKEMVEAQNTLWVRGEVLMYKEDFEALNKQLERNGQPKMANERNAAAGALRQKDPRVTWERKLHVVFYDMWDDSDYLYQTEEDMLCILQHLGFRSAHEDAMTVPMWAAEGSSALDVRLAIAWIAENREKFPFRIDGAVVKLNDKFAQEDMGNAEKFPKWAIAWKYEQPQYDTKLLDVQWQVGRTGRLTPVAWFEPVLIDGTSVKFATLNNPDYIAGLGGLREGDVVSVYKAAEIIPQVDRVVEPNESGKEFVTPDKCPVCGSKLERDGANLKCPDMLCKGKLTAMLTYFCSKPCMDIQGLGQSIIEELVERNIAWTVPDLYRLQVEDLMKLPRTTELVATKLYKAIQSSKQMPFDRVLCALGYRNVGTVASRRLTEKFPSYKELVLASEAQLAAVPGIGKIKAKEIWEDINNEENRGIVDQLIGFGLKFECEKPATQLDNTLQDKGFCFTGKLSHPRDWYRSFVSSHGGMFKEAVTGSLDYLVAGDGGGSKRSKAKALGIPIITEEQLMEMADGSGSSGN